MIISSPRFVPDYHYTLSLYCKTNISDFSDSQWQPELWWPDRSSLLSHWILQMQGNGLTWELFTLLANSWTQDSCFELVQGLVQAHPLHGQGLWHPSQWERVQSCLEVSWLILASLLSFLYVLHLQKNLQAKCCSERHQDNWHVCYQGSIFKIHPRGPVNLELFSGSARLEGGCWALEAGEPHHGQVVSRRQCWGEAKGFHLQVLVWARVMSGLTASYL